MIKDDNQPKDGLPQKKKRGRPKRIRDWQIDPQKYKPENQPKDKRKCLSCGKMFLSFGIQNRICKTCKLNDSWKNPEL